ALAAGGAACREAEACAALAHAGLPAAWIGRPPRDPAEAGAPPDHPLVAGLSRAVRAAPPGLPWRERPIALAALEDATDARSQAWSRMAEAMAPVALVLRRPAGPEAHLPHEAELRRWIYARSQVVLHLHAATPRAVGAEAAAEAADARAVLLAEPSPPHPWLRAGAHYAESSARRMPARLAELAADPEGSVRMASALADAQRLAFEPERLGLELVLALLGPERAA
ncbi:MAG: hypothetical protein INR64_16165, partial [Caulobacteraceae bacterium]|nr:hypothetical protein [Caulobacter sp.]